MGKELLHTIALDDSGSFIHIDDAEKGRVYYCPSCKGDFILRKSGKIGKGSKRPHFAHNELTPNCTAESALHYSFKTQLADLLNKYISEKKGLVINWSCPTCAESYQGYLLTKTTSVKVEYNLKVCQPDITLLDVKGNVIAVIEIVVTHAPEEKVLQYYKENEIILIQINLSSDEDLKNIEGKISVPNIVDYCLSHSCSNSMRRSINRRIFAFRDSCRNFHPIVRYKVEIINAFGLYRTLNFTDQEIDIVKSKRKNIIVRTDPKTKYKYPETDCINCKRMRVRYGGGRRF